MSWPDSKTIFAASFEYNDLDQRTSIETERRVPGVDEPVEEKMEVKDDGDDAPTFEDPATPSDGNAPSVPTVTEDFQDGDAGDPWPEAWIFNEQTATFAGQARESVHEATGNDDKAGRMRFTTGDEPTAVIAFHNALEARGVEETSKRTTNPAFARPGGGTSLGVWHREPPFDERRRRRNTTMGQPWRIGGGVRRA